MSRVIHTETAGKDRTRLSRAVVLALRELMHLSEPDDTARDLAAFIALALLEIAETVDQSVGAWEKRGYWVKAERFRMDWDWSGRLSRSMRQSILDEDWANIALLSAQIAQKFATIKLPVRHRLGTPWVGAYQELLRRK
ncbi:MAG TPA: hypothetical protein PKH92_06875 [Anaerolineaceae bacterium]|nr:hypothetical protein [Anaerolineaceae bacterium]